MTKLLCTGDLHLGAWPEYGRAPGDRLADQEQVWLRIVELAADENVDGILFAGDAFHRASPPPPVEQLFVFASGLDRAHYHGIPIVAINGNSHDVRSADMNLPIALDVFDGQHGMAPMLHLARTPQLVHAIPGVTVACLPWAPAAHLVAAHGGGDRDQLHHDVAEHLIAVARGLRADCAAGQPAVLLLHWSISGAVTPDGADVGLFREPVLDLAALATLGFDAVIAGHIHRQQLLCTDPPVGYVGSPMPLNFGDRNGTHGCWILNVDEDGASVEFVEIPSRPFRQLNLEPSDEAGGVVWPEMWVDGIDEAVVKVKLQVTPEQARRLDTREVRDLILQAGASKVFVDQEIIRPERARVEGLTETVGELDAVGLYCGAQELDGVTTEQLRARTVAYLEEAGR